MQVHIVPTQWPPGGMQLSTAPFCLLSALFTALFSDQPLVTRDGESVVHMFLVSLSCSRGTTYGLCYAHTHSALRRGLFALMVWLISGGGPEPPDGLPPKLLNMPITGVPSPQKCGVWFPGIGILPISANTESIESIV